MTSQFGQVLTMWRDLLPAAYINELELLHDQQVPAMDIAAVRATVEAELGAPLTTLFTSFCATPLAATTIIGGSLLLIARIDGWLHLLGEFMLTSGFIGMIIIGIGALRGGHDRR